MNAMARRRALLIDSDSAAGAEDRKPRVAETRAQAQAQEVEADEIVEVGPARSTRGHERPFAAQIDCPVCEEALEAPSSILQSVRCEACGHLLGFDEVMALRAAEHARTSRYI